MAALVVLAILGLREFFRMAEPERPCRCCRRARSPAEW